MNGMEHNYYNKSRYKEEMLYLRVGNIIILVKLKESICFWCASCIRRKTMHVLFSHLYWNF